MSASLLPSFPMSLPPSPPSTPLVDARSAKSSERAVKAKPPKMKAAQRPNAPPSHLHGWVAFFTFLAFIIQNEVCALQSNSLPGNVLSVYGSLVLLVVMLPIAFEERSQLICSMWSFGMIGAPLLFIADDLGRTPSGMYSRMGVLPNIAPFSAAAHGLVGFIHGALPLPPAQQRKLLLAECSLFAFRGLYLSTMTGQVHLPLFGAALALIPTVAAFSFSRAFHINLLRPLKAVPV